MAYRISNRLKYQIQTFINNEYDRRLLYEALENYEKEKDINDLVTCLKKALNEPARLRLFDIIRPLIIPQQQMDYNMLVPYISNRQRTLKLTRSKESAAFGFSIRGGREHGIGVFVSEVVEGSTAFNRGLKVGDQIIRINGLSIDEAIHEEVLNLISKSKKSLVLKVKSVGMIPVKSFDDEGEFGDETRSFLDALPPLSPTLTISPTSPLSPSSMSDSSEHYPLTYIQNRGRRKSLVSTTSSRRSEALSWVLANDVVSPEFKYASMRTNVNEIMEVKIFVDVSKTQKFGCSICMGPANLSGIFVQSTAKGGLAEEVGLETGDQIISCNGIQFDKLSFPDAVKYLKSNKRVELIVRKRAGADLFTESKNGQPMNGYTSGLSSYNSENVSNLTPLEETKAFVEITAQNGFDEFRENHEEQKFINEEIKLKDEVKPIKNIEPIAVTPVTDKEPIAITPVVDIEPIVVTPIKDIEPIKEIETIAIALIEPIPIAPMMDIETITIAPMEQKVDETILLDNVKAKERFEEKEVVRIELPQSPPPPLFLRIDSEDEKAKREIEKTEELKRQTAYASKLEAKKREDDVVDFIQSAAIIQRKSLAFSFSEMSSDAPSLLVSPSELERLQLLHQTSIDQQNEEIVANENSNNSILKSSPKVPKRKDGVTQPNVDLTKLQSNDFDKFDLNEAPKPLIRRKSVSFDLNENNQVNDVERKVSTLSSGSIGSSNSDRRQSIVVLAVKPTPHMFVDPSMKLDEVVVEVEAPKPQLGFRKKSPTVVASPAKVATHKKSITDSSLPPPKPPNFFFTKQSKLPNVTIGSYSEAPPPRVSYVQPKIKIESKPINTNAINNTNLSKNIIINNNNTGKADLNYKNKINETKTSTQNKLNPSNKFEVNVKAKSTPVNPVEPEPVSSFSAARAKFMINEMNQNNVNYKALQNGHHSISIKTDQEIVIVKKK